MGVISGNSYLYYIYYIVYTKSICYLGVIKVLTKYHTDHMGYRLETPIETPNRFKAHYRRSTPRP
jgi:hypothetical protein